MKNINCTPEIRSLNEEKYEITFIQIVATDECLMCKLLKGKNCMKRMN